MDIRVKCVRFVSFAVLLMVQIAIFTAIIIWLLDKYMDNPIIMPFVYMIIVIVALILLAMTCHVYEKSKGK